MRTRKIKGGKVIDSGGFGCVFRPSLPCATRRSQGSSDRFISKLMSSKHATEEYKIARKIRNIVKKLPNYKNYFILDNTICKPAKISNQDMESMKKKCERLIKSTKRSKKSSDTNNSSDTNKIISQMLILTMPYGGIPVDDYLLENPFFVSIQTLHIGLTNLLIHGILPMNKLHLYHSDVKESNILVNEDERPRLIDWGLSVHHVNTKTIPKMWENRPFQFNIPFTCVMFNTTFVKRFKSFTTATPRFNESQLLAFCERFLREWISVRGSGHYRYINGIMHMLYGETCSSSLSEKQVDKIIETRYTIPALKNSIARVIVDYYHPDKSINDFLIEYVNQEYVHEVDVWGFLMSYITMFNLGIANAQVLSSSENAIIQQIKSMIETHVYTLKPKRMDIAKIIEELHQITRQFETLSYLTNLVSMHPLDAPAPSRFKNVGSFANY